MGRQSHRDATALAAQRDRDRQLAISDTSALCEYVAEMADAGQLERRRAGGVPVIPGGRLWLAVKLYLDHPDVFADARRGEYTSITAAARQAGVVKPRRRLTIGSDPKVWATALFHSVSRDELLAAAAVLNELEERRDDPDSQRARRQRDSQMAGKRIERVLAQRRRRR